MAAHGSQPVNRPLQGLRVPLQGLDLAALQTVTVEHFAIDHRLTPTRLPEQGQHHQPGCLVLFLVAFQGPLRDAKVARDAPPAARGQIVKQERKRGQLRRGFEHGKSAQLWTPGGPFQCQKWHAGNST